MNDQIKEILKQLKDKTITPQQAKEMMHRINNASESDAGHAKTSSAGVTVNTADLPVDTVNNEVKRIAAAIMNVSPEDIDVDVDFGEYGLDSVSIVMFIDKINEFYGIEASPAVLFELKTLNDLSEYLIREHRQAVFSTFSDNRSYSENKEPEVQSVVISGNDNEKAYDTAVSCDLKDDDIVIVGMSCVMPMSENKEKFWKRLYNKECMITEADRSRWNDNADISGIYGGFIDHPYDFDPMFFNISQAEAELMDPQQRIFLEQVWNAVEDAGYKMSDLSGEKVGVYAGVGTHDFTEILLESGNIEKPYSATGIAHSVLANRISYLFDFKGPSEPIDTACSSSLVAVHNAVESLRANECRIAIAGGVNVMISPSLFRAFQNSGMLSPEGKCKTFDAKADGYVRGEGAGAFVLKKLSEAKKDRDHIYAVIKGSAVAHGGKVSSLTVPNPVAQAEMICDVWERSDLDINNLSYIEAHGTGTALGDPVEVNGLKKAFRAYCDKKHISFSDISGKCYLGSVKPNVGHLETAAGVAGMAKIIMSIKNKFLPGNVNFEKLNPYITFEDVPLQVLENGVKWNNRQNADGVEPLTAAISSFGFGGVISHVVFEEYIDSRKVDDMDSEEVFILSAATQNQLKEYCIKILDWLKEEKNDVRCNDISFTLINGREEFSSRLAFIFRSVDDLEKKLSAFIDGGMSTEVFCGKADNSSAEIIICDRSNVSECARLWAEGGRVDWSGIMPSDAFRISMPTYPYAKHLCWPEQNRISLSEKLDKFIDRNISTINEHRFVKRFTLDDDYVKDHIVGEKYMLPAAVSLEMALEACRLSSKDPHMNQVYSVEWKRSILIGQPYTDVVIDLSPEGKDIFFEISLLNSDSDTEVCVSGYAASSSTAEKSVDVNDLIDTFDEEYSKKEIYDYFDNVSMLYGGLLRCVENVKVSGRTALARIDIAHCSANDFILSPAVTDCAFQSFITISDLSSKKNAYHLPYSAERITVFGKASDICYAYIVKTDETASVRKYDISLINDKGMVFAEFSGMCTHSFAHDNIGVINYSCNYIRQDIEASASADDISYIVIDTDTGFCDELRRHCCDVNYLEYVSASDMAASSDRISDRFESLYSGLKDHIAVINLTDRNSSADTDESILKSVLIPMGIAKKLIDGRTGRKLSFVNVYNRDNKDISYYAAAAAFGRSLNKEWDNFELKSIRTDGVFYNNRKLVDIVQNEVNNSSCYDEICYDGGTRMVKKYSRIEEAVASSDSINRNGVYLIAGGGKIGCDLAAYLAHNYCARSVIFSRNADASKYSDNADISCFRGDITVSSDIAALSRFISERYGRLDGIFQCAGRISDSTVANKSADEFLANIKPKVQGTNNILALAEQFGVGFVVMFSSISAMFGNEGQSDYAYANAYMDSLASENTSDCHMLSVQWPLWKDGGMNVDRSRQDYLKEKYGLHLMGTDTAFEQLRKLISSDRSFEAVMYGNTGRIAASVGAMYNTDRVSQADASVLASDVGGLVAWLKELFAKSFKISPDSINEKLPLEKYGLDSIMIMDLSRGLEKYFDKISKTMFYECLTLKDIAAYLIEHYPAAVNNILPESGNSSVGEQVSDIKLPKAKKAYARSKSFVNENEDIAIIGISGRYPLADDLAEFWTNLSEGRDCITEGGRERWDSYGYNNITSYMGGFINDYDMFDPLFFNISPNEAATIDPQERLFLETVWHTIESSGYRKSDLEGSNTGVFVGVMYGQYQLLGVEETAKGNIVSVPSYYASVANRISYFYNFTGPSLALDTMCSSSLTSVYLACESLIRNDCETAIAGGVNLSIHPHKYSILSQTGFIAPKGKCRSFSADGDGYIPGEGVGAVLLKRYDKAVRDGDRIYAVIKGGALNHGGKTNGYTVPNPNAQMLLICSALDKTGISPDSIQYVEAHGTGTPLGDPIEINGITRAFRKYTDKKGFCSIGSVKSNIGHLESAAGIAAITKIVLQMMNKKLVPSIHSESINHDIDFEATPFYLQKELSDWKVSGGAKRRAAVSSFGAGGSNAHLILEEYVEGNTAESYTTDDVYVIPVSAASKASLKSYCVLLTNLIRENADVTIGDIAYSMAVSKEALNYRAAFIAKDKEELLDLLRRFNEDIPDEKVLVSSFYDFDEVKNKYLGKIDEISSRGFKNAVRWCCFDDLDWRDYYGTGFRKTDLPLYPFEKHRCWIKTTSSSVTAESKGIDWIDGFNISDNMNSGIEMKKTVSSDDAYIKHHIVLGQRILPGAFSVHIIWSALHKLFGDEKFRIESLTWREKVIVDHTKELIVRIRNDGDYVIAECFDKNDRSIIYVDCKAKRISESLGYAINDINELKDGCCISVDVEQLYDYFSEGGIVYGENFRLIRELSVGNGEAAGVIESMDTVHGFDPIIIDAAFQTISAIYLNSDKRSSLTAVPYSIQEYILCNKVSRRSYVYTVQKDETHFDIAVINSDNEVSVLIRDLEIAVVPSAGKHISLSDSFAEDVSDSDILDICYVNEWKKADISDITSVSENSYSGSVIFYTEYTERLKDAIIEHSGESWTAIKLSNEYFAEFDSYGIDVNDPDAISDLSSRLRDYDRIVFLGSSGNNNDIGTAELESIQQTGLMSLFRLFRTFDASSAVDIKLVTDRVYHFENDDRSTFPSDASMIGFFRAAVSEYPEVFGAVIDVDAEQAAENKNGEIDLILSAEVKSAPEVTLVREGRVFRSGIRNCRNNELSSRPVFKKGTYLIIGGTGGIGFELSKTLSEKYNADIIVTGRREQDDTVTEKINKVNSLGGRCEYIRADVADIQDMQAVREHIIGRYGKIDGVIHSALYLNDVSVANMSEDTLKNVLRPKTYGPVVLHEVFKDDRLDFVLYFSSAQSLAPSPGQSNYAAASVFEDQIARYYSSPEYPSWVINWGYWGTVGRVANDRYRKSLERKGFYSINIPEGMKAISMVIGSDAEQVAVMKCSDSILSYFGYHADAEEEISESVYEETEEAQEALSGDDSRNEDIKTAAATAVKTDEKALYDRVYSIIIDSIVDILGVDANSIEKNKQFSEYGIDSITGLEFVKSINEQLGLAMRTTIVFDYGNVEALTKYIIAEYSDKLGNNL
ncbi:SDR family NAD(P)-dependent oxidoreductase [uncultured Ruminococcus sp.]|uniref:SDR family NAD(P)-dependent oxidoreductase n=1 Tax=uncultured Ruminococcus sp. TaxID=165186 RepID=UPI002606B36F|nr:SDR family NAD(P)-dependent oxidoreductase [uncultured Ruminococcus sp.]